MRNSHLQLLEKSQLAKSQLELEPYCTCWKCQYKKKLSFIVRVVQLESLKLDNTFVSYLYSLKRISKLREASDMYVKHNAGVKKLNM